jgi:SP family myo-inositol transporter-like MFS transporter 13
MKIALHGSSSTALGAARYRLLLLSTAGFGGLLYGVDIGIIAAALLYLGRTVQLSVTQTSLIVAAVLAGSMISSPLGGLLADWLGRKKTMLLAALMFLMSIVLIVVSQKFASLFVGRLLQGMSGGIIAVVVPLYLAECLDAKTRGRGTALFQFMLTVGIAVASLVGWFYTRRAEIQIASANGSQMLIHEAQSRAWRSMFLSILYPGIVFFVGILFLQESPRWLLRSSPSAESAQDELALIQTAGQQTKKDLGGSSSLWQRRYIVPFLLACIVLACNQATGINTILGFLVMILTHAGLTATHATQGDAAVKILNCVITVVAIALVDKKGRKFLLKLGTAGIFISLLSASFIFFRFESTRLDATREIMGAQVNEKLDYPLDKTISGKPAALTVLYSYGDGTHMTTASDSTGPTFLHIAPSSSGQKLRIRKAFYCAEPSSWVGWAITACLGIFIASFSIGPGVVVWLVLSELMPTRIRSRGMGIALLFNQGVSTVIAASFLPVVGSLGYYAVFAIWTGCSLFYFLIATFFLPETKGRTLEEIETSFAEPGRRLEAL